LANAADTDTALSTKVEFFKGTTKLGGLQQLPSLIGICGCAYALTVATDDNGAAAGYNKYYSGAPSPFTFVATGDAYGSAIWRMQQPIFRQEPNCKMI